MTVLYYLNDVEEGGETAFPMADNTTRNMEVRCSSGNLEIREKIFTLSFVVEANLPSVENVLTGRFWSPL